MYVFSSCLPLIPSSWFVRWSWPFSLDLFRMGKSRFHPIPTLTYGLGCIGWKEMLRFAPTEAPDLNDPRLPLSIKDLNELEKNFSWFSSRRCGNIFFGAVVFRNGMPSIQTWISQAALIDCYQLGTELLIIFMWMIRLVLAYRTRSSFINTWVSYSGEIFRSRPTSFQEELYAFTYYDRTRKRCVISMVSHTYDTSPILHI